MKKHMEFGVSVHKGSKKCLKSGDNTTFPHAIFKIVLSFVVFGLICLILNQSNSTDQLVKGSHTLFHQQGSRNNFTSSLKELKFEDEIYGDDDSLENILKRAAMKDHKTVIITTLNAAWTEPDSIFDLFMESFRIGNQTQRLLKHVIVVAFDKKAHERCLSIHPNCFIIKTDDYDMSGPVRFMSTGYLKMMWKRIDFLRSILEMGYNFIFSDADIMWLRDPFPRFYPDGDFQIACDLFTHNSTNRKNYPNGGFTYVKSNDRTIRFYKFWYDARLTFPNKHDQDVFNEIKFDPFIDRIGLQIRFLDTAYFGGFCEPSKDLDLVVTMHANCCVGLKRKIHDIKMLIEDWKMYSALFGGGNENNLSKKMSWSVPIECGLKKHN